MNFIHETWSFFGNYHFFGNFVPCLQQRGTKNTTFRPEIQRREEFEMSIEQRLAQARERRSISHEDIEMAVRQGRRLRAEAVRGAFNMLRPALGPNS